MYQALYRKWRPQTFDQVVGQKHITETLKNQVMTGRLSHAYIFIGTRGTGKTTCARILARAVNCEHPVNGSPCGVCPACRGIADGSILDVVELDAASNNGVDNVRALRDEAVFSPAAVKKRVYIIDEVHMLSTPAFNALLKILEEPPEHLMFILATTELQKVPATILSRCQRHSFKRLDSSVIAEYLEYIASQEHMKLTHEAAEIIARLADGGVRDALTLLDQCSASGNIDVEAVYSAMGLAGNLRIAELLDNIIGGDTAAALRSFDALWMDGKDPATLLGELNGLMRDVLMTQVMISRTHPGLVKRLFELEVPEIYDGTVEVKSIAREAGSRTKMAVWSADENVDPIGACVGPKGQRVAAIVDELRGEKIDIIKWSEDPAQFIAAALAPSVGLVVGGQGAGEFLAAVHRLVELHQHGAVQIPLEVGGTLQHPLGAGGAYL